MRLTTSRKDFHRHSFEVSPCGNGVTTLNLDHRHEIKGFVVHEVNGHSHILYGIPDKCTESSKKAKYTGSTSQSIEEKSINVYGEIPHDREYGDHRRVAAIKKLIYGINESSKINEEKYLMNVKTGSVDTYDNWKSDSENDGWNFDKELSSGNLVSVKKDNSGDWVEEKSINVYGEIPHDREYGDHRRVAAIKKLIYGEDK
jgi:hypothetical protein